MTNNIIKMDMKEAQEYLLFVSEILGELIWNRTVFLDFWGALKEQNCKRNFFTDWAFQNYYKIMILNLCKILEPRKYDIDKCTLRHFIICMKNTDTGNYQMLESAMREATIENHNTRTGECEIEDVSRLMMEGFKQIDFDNDLNVIVSMHEKLEKYRNKKLCHNQKFSIDEKSLPSVNELHACIDVLEKKFKDYFHLFRMGISYDNLKTPNKYGNFKLYLK